MSDQALVAQQPVAIVTVETESGPNLVVVTQQVAAFVAAAGQGAAGRDGRDGGGSSGFSMTAGSALSGHRVVRPGPDGRAVYASCLTGGDAISAIGITAGAADENQPVVVISSYDLVESSWSWSTGKPVWLGPAGALVQPQPAFGDLRQIGVALSPTRISVGLGPTIIRT